MTATASHEITLDLDQPDDVLVKQIADTLEQLERDVKQHGAMELSFRLRKTGADDRQFQYQLTSDAFTKAEQDVVFPQIVSEILRKEFPAKVAQNEQLRQHVMNELRQDPYWSTQVVELVKAMRAR